MIKKRNEKGMVHSNRHNLFLEIIIFGVIAMVLCLPNKVGATETKAPFFNNEPSKFLTTPLYEQDLASGFLDEYERLNTNEPVKFKVRGDLNPGNREYYLSFGSVNMLALDAGRSSRYIQFGNAILPSGWPGPNELSAPTLSRWGILAKAAEKGEGPTVGPEGSKPSVVQYMTHQFFTGRINAASLDFEVYAAKELSGFGKSSLIANSAGKTSNNSSTLEPKSGTMLIRHLYKQDDENGTRLVAYAPVVDKKEALYGYIRMILSPEGDTGRISNKITFQSMRDDPTYFSFVQGAHTDLAGTHRDTMIRSTGNDSGIYMGIHGRGMQQTPDKKPYRLYYYTDDYDNKPDTANYKGDMDLMSDYIAGELLGYDPLKEGYPVDPGANKSVGATYHPALAWGYKARQLEYGEKYEMRFDEAVTSEEWKEDREIITRYLDQDGNELDAQNPTSVMLPKGNVVYTTDSKEAELLLKGWALDTTRLPKNAIGTVGNDDTAIVVDYYFNDQRQNPLTIKYQDLDGAELAPDNVEDYKIDETYTATALDLSAKGWTLVDPTTSPQTGQMGSSPKEIIFTYRKGEVNVVTEYYIKDKNSKLSELFPKVTDTYEYLKDYQTLSKEQDALALGYVLESDNTGAPKEGITGQVDETVIVKYVYVEGTVKLTAPASIDFGVKNLITAGYNTILPTENIKVSIVDQLKGRWELTLGISDDITNDVSNDNIKGKFYFVRNDGSSEDVTRTPIKIQSKSVEGIISKLDLEWNVQQNKGLIFKQYVGNQKGNYSGQFTWTLQDAP